MNEGSLHTPRASWKLRGLLPSGTQTWVPWSVRSRFSVSPPFLSSAGYRTLHKLDKCPTLSSETKPFALFLLSQGLTKLPRLNWLELALWHRQPRTWDLPASAS